MVMDKQVTNLWFIALMILSFGAKIPIPELKIDRNHVWFFFRSEKWINRDKKKREIQSPALGIILV